MNNFIPQAKGAEAAAAAAAGGPQGGSAFSLLEKSWRDVKASADADLRLIKDRATSFTSSYSREFENFLTSAAATSSFSVPSPMKGGGGAAAEIDLFKKFQPKISEFRRVASSPDLKRSVLNWPRGGGKVGVVRRRLEVVEEEEREWRGEWERTVREVKARWKDEVEKIKVRKNGTRV